MAPGVLWEHEMPVCAKSAGRDLQVQLLYEALGLLQQTRQKTMDIFALMAIKVCALSYIQGLVTKFATNPPRGTVGHQRKSPLWCSRPSDKDHQSGKQFRRVPLWSHSFTIVVWGWNLMLGVEDE